MQNRKKQKKKKTEKQTRITSQFKLIVETCVGREKEKGRGATRVIAYHLYLFVYKNTCVCV